MKIIATITRACYATILVAIIGLSAYGCRDTVSVSPDVAVPLSSLTITPGSLQPAFSSNTTNYTVDVSTSVTSVIVTASPKESTTTIAINGVVTNPGQGRTVPLSSSGTTTNITIVLTNQNGIESTYEIVVRKVDNNLSALSATPGSLVPAFTANTLNYQVDVSSGVASVTVSATKLDPRAIMSGSVPAGAGVATGQATIPLNGPGLPTVVSITVAVLNGDAKTYTITVNRLSGDNTLSALSITPGTLNPPFAANISGYIVNVTTDVTEVTVRATKSDRNAVMQVHSVTVPAGTLSGQDTVPLNGPGTDTIVTINVTAQDGTPKQPPYTITVKRAAPSSDNNLSALSLTAGSVPLNLTPPFDRNQLNYTVEAPFGTLEVTVTATKSDPNATMTINGQGTSTGQATIPFIFLPPPQVSITVTAPDGSNKTYTVTVNQAPPPPPFP